MSNATLLEISSRISFKSPPPCVLCCCPFLWRWPCCWLCIFGAATECGILCWILVLSCVFLCPFWFRNPLADERELVALLWLSCVSSSLCRGLICSLWAWHFLVGHTHFVGAPWLSGRVLDSRPKGREFEPHWRHCVVVLEQEQLS